MDVGLGVYRLSEVARYTRLPASTVRSWFEWRSDRTGRGPLFHADYRSVNGEHAVSFLNLIETHVARLFRKEGVSSLTIRRAYDVLQQELGPHPFAHAELRTDGRRIIRETADKLGSRQFTDVITRQHWFAEMSDCLKQIVYEPQSRLAIRWQIAAGVVLDPRVSFGQPVVQSCGTTTLVLANQYNANGGNVALVADLYHVDEQDVLNAVRFEQQIRAARRAA